MTLSLTDQAHEYHRQLQTSDQGLEYLASRGISQRSIDKFLLGWITEPLTPDVRYYTGKPVIPYLATSGKVTWLRVRSGGTAKYLPIGSDYPLAEPRIHLFNAQQAMPSPSDPRVFIIEGEYDAIVAVQCGLRAVAVPGARNWYAAWTHLFADSQPVVAFDGDDTGTDAAQRLVHLFTSRRIPARSVALPTGTDVTDLFLQGGRDRVLEVLR